MHGLNQSVSNMSRKHTTVTCQLHPPVTQSNMQKWKKMKLLTPGNLLSILISTFLLFLLHVSY